MKINARGGSLEVKLYEEAWMLCVFSAGMTCVGVKLLFEQWSATTSFHWGDAVGTAFLFVWIGFVLWMGCKGYEYASTALVLCEEGVGLYSPWRKRELKWEEIRDYGICYVKKERGRNIYELYFSENPKRLESGKDKRRGKPDLRITVSGRQNRDQVVSRILPYCRTRVQAEPFLTDGYGF